VTFVAPYGTWASPISAQTVAEQGLRLGFVACDGDDIYWLEGRPQEGGRNVLVRRRGADGSVVDVTPPDHNVRTRVHEYGGGAYIVRDGVVYYSNFADQRIYTLPVISRTNLEGSSPRHSMTDAPTAITPEGKWFYADAALDERRSRLICVREDHTHEGREPVNTLVSIPLDGDANAGHVLASGYDFYSTPRLSPDGSQLCWLSWRHPQMPWDGTELWVATITTAGTLDNVELVAGGPHESIFQPGWSPGGTLYFASDRNGWWLLYRCDVRQEPLEIQPVLKQPPDEAEFGRPQWMFGWATWACLDERLMVAAYVRRGRWSLAAIDVERGTLTDIATPFEPLEWVAVSSSHAVYVGASPSHAPAVVRTDFVTGTTEILRSSSSLALDRLHVSIPEAVEFPTEGGITAHAFYYPPCNVEYHAAPSDRPPLIVISHGGPTTQTKAVLDLQVQFWTTRGFAVVDVNYGGSTGYGREYRQRLHGYWGIVDVDDNVNVSRYLVEQGRADPARLIIRGGSAGGYTTLAALTFHPDVFRAGASYYGVSDVEALAKDTHKFESRYLDTLIGPYPDAKEVYRERSPIHFSDRLSCALILFQGLEDKVVPPDQSERMAHAVRAKGLPVAYLAFAGEQHGFRRAETIIRCLEAELYFYGAVFAFTPAGSVAPIEIDNLR
jgi:dipeptidyl aminopeptidase/acylaminoacyl peptidase